MKRNYGALFASALCASFAAGVLAHGENLDSAVTDGVLTEHEARKILVQLMPTPTPYDATMAVLITADGNVLVNARPWIIVQAGVSPGASVPQRCRADFDGAPKGTFVLCMTNDRLWKIVSGEAP